MVHSRAYASRAVLHHCTHILQAAVRHSLRCRLHMHSSVMVCHSPFSGEAMRACVGFCSWAAFMRLNTSLCASKGVCDRGGKLRWQGKTGNSTSEAALMPWRCEMAFGADGCSQSSRVCGIRAKAADRLLS